MKAQKFLEFNFIYIIFRDKIFYIDRKNKEQYDEAKRYSISLGIPEYQVDFHPRGREVEKIIDKEVKNMFKKLFANCLLVSDFEKSLAFYRNTIGLEINSTEGKFADFKLEGTSLAIFEKKAATNCFLKFVINTILLTTSLLGNKKYIPGFSTKSHLCQ